MCILHSFALLNNEELIFACFIIYTHINIENFRIQQKKEMNEKLSCFFDKNYIRVNRNLKLQFHFYSIDVRAQYCGT